MVPAERFEVGEDYPLPVSEPIMCSYHKVGGGYVLDADKRGETGGTRGSTSRSATTGTSTPEGSKGIFSAAEFGRSWNTLTVRAELRELVDSTTKE